MNINPFIKLISNVIYLLNIVLIVYIVMSWLIAFNIINRHQPLVARVYDILTRITEPLLRPIRRILPDINGIDLSPIVLFLLLQLLNNVLFEYFYKV